METKSRPSTAKPEAVFALDFRQFLLCGQAAHQIAVVIFIMAKVNSGRGGTGGLRSQKAAFFVKILQPVHPIADCHYLIATGTGMADIIPR